MNLGTVWKGVLRSTGTILGLSFFMLCGSETQARAAIGSKNSVYYSSYCQQYRCVLKRVTTSHADGTDFLIYRYRLKDGSSLVVSRFEPDPTLPHPSDNQVEALTLHLPKTLTPLQLERRLSELIHAGTGSASRRWRFNFAHKCTRPSQAGYPFHSAGYYPFHGEELKLSWNTLMARDYTLPIAGKNGPYRVTCIWESRRWLLAVHGGYNIFPYSDGRYQVWP